MWHFHVLDKDGFFFFFKKNLDKDVNDEFIKDDYFKISKRLFW